MDSLQIRKQKAGAVMLTGYYAIWDNYYDDSVIAKASSDDVADEIAKFLYKDKGSYCTVHSYSIASTINAVQMLRLCSYKHAYIMTDGILIEYKTRIDFIDEVLNEL